MKEFNSQQNYYGVTTPKLGYAGVAAPTNTADAEYQDMLSRYNLDQQTYNDWLNQYNSQIESTPMYGQGYQGPQLGAPAYTYGAGYTSPLSETPSAASEVEAAIPKVFDTHSRGGDGYSSVGNTSAWSGFNPNSYTGGLLGAMLGTTNQLAPVDYSRDTYSANASAQAGLSPDLSAAMGQMDAQAAENDSQGGYGGGAQSGISNGGGMDTSYGGMDASGFGGDYGGGGNDSSSGDSGGTNSDGGTGDTGSDGSGGGGTGDSDSSDNGMCRGGMVKRKYADGGLADLYGKYNPDEGAQFNVPELTVEPTVTGNGNISPALRQFIAQDAIQQGVTNPVADFKGATGKGGSYGLQMTPEAAQPEPLEQMYAKYEQPPNMYGAELAEARKSAAAESERFNKLLENAMAQPAAAGPSKAEMYFQLAAAFGAPTKTGSFMESVGEASKVMGAHQKAIREAEQSGKQQKLQLGLEVSKARMGAAKEDVNALRQLAGEELKAYIASGKPQSAAGKQAQDEGYRPGTPEYQQRVAEVGEMLIKRQTAQIDALVASQGAQKTQADIAQAKLDEQKKQGARLTPKELDLRVETEDAINAGTSALGALEKALELNPTTFDASLKDQAQKLLLQETQTDHPRVKATREQENLLATQAVTQLKTLVGGNPTEGERTILLSLQGIGAKGREERKTIIENAMKAVKTRIERNKKRLTDIKAGRYRDTTVEDTGAE